MKCKDLYDVERLLITCPVLGGGSTGTNPPPSLEEMLMNEFQVSQMHSGMQELSSQNSTNYLMSPAVGARLASAQGSLQQSHFTFHSSDAGHIPAPSWAIP